MPATARTAAFTRVLDVQFWLMGRDAEHPDGNLLPPLGFTRQTVPGDEGVSVTEISIGEFARRSRLSLKALRLYDERGVLVPSRVDQASGYRYYDTAQLDQAGLVVIMRQLQLPLAAVKELLASDPDDAATRIAEHWRDAEAAHDARRRPRCCQADRPRRAARSRRRPEPSALLALNS